MIKEIKLIERGPGRPKGVIVNLDSEQGGYLPLDMHHTKSLHYKALHVAESMEQFISFIAASMSDPRAQEFAKGFRKARGNNKNLFLDEYAKKKGVDASIIWAWASEGAYREGQQTIRFIHSKNAHKVAQANADNAILPGKAGFGDRNLFLKAAGVMPTSRGTNVNVVQSNVNTANAAAKSETSLPQFDSQRREIAEAVRADE
jgi:hypothetical protein